MGKNSKIEIDKRWFPLYQGLIRLEESIIWNKRIISWYSGLFDRLQLRREDFQKSIGRKIVSNINIAMIQKLWSYQNRRRG